MLAPGEEEASRGSLQDQIAAVFESSGMTREAARAQARLIQSDS